MWEQIRANRVRSVMLVAAMAVVLLGVGYFIGVIVLGTAAGGLAVALVIWGVMTALAFFQGDNIFLSLSRAKKIEREDHPRLYNIVEEMKIASGLEYMPDVYIIDDPALNAFATGRDPKRASVAVTSGLLEKLNRDELQGVIGHEMAHIQNRDVLLMTLCGVLLGAVVMLSWYMTRAIFWSGRTRRDSGRGGGQAILIIVGIVLIILAPIFARLIYYALSRRREYLADASSAQYTRYPEGLASALEKLAESTAELQTANKAMAPMYITNPFRKEGMAAGDLTSTHPPISERIRILRSMAGGASYAEYNRAYASVHKGGRNIIPASALAATAPVGLRPATVPEEAELSRVERAREVNDLLWRQADYRTINCDCGTKLKVPPNLNKPEITCPHCGRVHSVR